MALNIKSGETEALARALAGETGESLTEAVRVALAERLDRVRGSRSEQVTDRKERLLAIGRDAAPRWREPYRSGDHGDLLHDDHGLPR